MSSSKHSEEPVYLGFRAKIYLKQLYPLNITFLQIHILYLQEQDPYTASTGSPDEKMRGGTRDSSSLVVRERRNRNTLQQQLQQVSY